MRHLILEGTNGAQAPRFELAKVVPHIGPFKGKHAFLSNFHNAPVFFRRVRYPTVENAYQAAKCRHMQDRRQFVEATPGQAKKMGREVNMRQDWERVKVPIMLDLLHQKFQDENLGRLLRETHGYTLVEINTWGDTFWGVSGGRGHNVLGELLMIVRTVMDEHLTRFG